jgi:hypothetical protein
MKRHKTPSVLKKNYLIRKTNFELPETKGRKQKTGHRFRITGNETQITDLELHGSRHRIRNTNFKKQKTKEGIGIIENYART